MTHRDLDTAEFNQLVDGFLIDSLSDGELSRLDLLRGNVGAQRFFLKYCQLHMDLTLDERAIEAMEKFADRKARMAPVAESALPLEGQSPASPPFQSWSVLSLAFCSLLAVATIGATIWWLTSGPTGQHIAVAENREDRPSTIKVKEGLPVITSLKTAGTATTMQLADIGYLTIDKQADFQLIGPKRARLNYGRIKMRVTEESGHGFVIETPDGEITDLGTEFGIDVSSGRQSLLAVFEGMVDLNVADQRLAKPHVERLLGGDGVLFNRGGVIDRLGSIRTGDLATFACMDDATTQGEESPLIAKVYDSLSPSSTKRFYEIVPKGMREDALAFVDRFEHNWNGLSRESGMPRYLRKADYVKTFSDDKRRVNENFELTVVINRPANLYILFDKRLTVPTWLSDNFERLDDYIGLDVGRLSPREKKKGAKLDPAQVIGKGPGQSIDCEFSIWKRTVDIAGSVSLGENGVNTSTANLASMYGIVAAEIGGKSSAEKENGNLKKPLTSGYRSRSG